MSQNRCTQCNNPIETSDKFCPHCGAVVEQPTEPQPKTAAPHAAKTIISSGNYSGTMTRGKGAGTRKIMRNIIIAIVLTAIIALIIWIKTDPNAKEKLGNILFGLILMAIFGAVIWRKSRKGLIQSSKQRKGNFDWDDDIVEPEIDSADDDADDD